MRIIIEDIPSSTQGLSPSLVETTSFEDGGPAPADLLHALAGLSPQLQDAGTPPAWLVKAVGEAFRQDPGRFAASPTSSGDMDTVKDAADGGSLGVQFQGSVPPHTSKSWTTHSWPEEWRVLWMVVPTGPVQDSAPQVEWKVKIERQAENLLKYYLEIRNLTSSAVEIESRYAILD